MNIKTTAKIEKNIFAEKGAKEGNKEIIIKTCAALISQAKTLAPVDQGQLKNTLMYKTSEVQDKFNDSPEEKAPEEQKLSVNPKTVGDGLYYEGYAGTNSDHWYPEFGTRYQIAQPFLRPAKEIIVDGGKAENIAKKYGPEKMEEEFRKRKKEVKNL